jgi:ubiquinone/menaquinone biosynthesis C-methylase UbiE
MISANEDFLTTYVGLAPLALAIERSLECEIFSRLLMERPVLDIGCGDGIFAKVVFSEKIDTGIDPNPIELAHARSLDVYAELIQCRGDAIPRPDAHFRTIFSNSVLEHIPQVNLVLREVHRLLAPGGTFYLTVPSDRFEQYAWLSRLLLLFDLHRLQKQFGKFYNQFWAHYHCYTPECWARLLEEAGFKVVTVRTYAPKVICTLDDVLAPLAIVGLVFKRSINRWTLVPELRRIVLSPATALVKRLIRQADQGDGGLVFLAARKS